MLRELAPGSHFGRWRIQKKLGQGGMGAVYAAEDPQRGAVVALKLVLTRDAALLARFEREARAARSVKHPNVAETYELVPVNGLPVLAMEVLPGGSLREAVATRGALPWREAASYGAAIARGLAAIHAHGLIHRDLKPANVLRDAQGVPKITDFGLVAKSAALSQSQGPLTKTGELLGTYAYMAPEQAEGKGPVDFRADLYSLGATLHELLSGRPPFEGEGYALVRQHLMEPPPSLAGRGIPKALDALVLRLLAKAPEDRPPSAADVARDLEEILRDTPTKPSSRRVAPLVAGALAVVAIAAGSALAVANATRSPPTPEKTTTPPPAPPPPATPTVPFAPEERAFHARLAKLPKAKLATLTLARGHDEPRHERAIRMVAFAGADTIVTGSDDETLRLWDATTLAAKGSLEMEGGVRSLAVSRDGKTAVVGTINGRCMAWDLGERRLLRDVPGHVGQVVVAISPDGAWAVSTASDDRTVKRWSTRGTTESRAGRFPGGAGPWFVRLQPDNSERAIVGLSNGQHFVVDFSSNAEPVHVNAHAGPALEGVFLADGSFASTGDDHRLVKLEGALASFSVPIHHDAKHVYAVDASADARTIATGGDDRRIERHDAKDGRLLGDFATGTIVYSLAFSPDGEKIAAGGSDGVVHVYAKNGRDLHPLAPETHRGPIHALALSRDGLVATAGEDGSVKVWEPRGDSLALRATRGGHAAAVMGVAFVEEKSRLRVLSAGYDDGLRLWSLDDEKARVLTAGGGARHRSAHALCVSPDGRRAVLNYSWDAPPRLYDLGADEIVETTAKLVPYQGAYDGAFTADGAAVVLAGDLDRGAKQFGAVYDLARAEWHMFSDEWYVESLALLDPRAERVALATQKHIAVWEPATNHRVWQVPTSVSVAALAALDHRVIALAGRRVLVLADVNDDAEASRGPADVIDLGAIGERPSALVADPAHHAIWLGTTSGAILRFSVRP